MKCFWCEEVAVAYCDTCKLGFCSDELYNFDDEWDSPMRDHPHQFEYHDSDGTGHDSQCDICLFVPEEHPLYKT